MLTLMLILIPVWSTCTAKFLYYDHLKLRHLIYQKPYLQSLSYSFLCFLHPMNFWLETTFGTVQKWSLRPLLDSPKDGLNKRGFTVYQKKLHSHSVKMKVISLEYPNFSAFRIRADRETTNRDVRIPHTTCPISLWIIRIFQFISPMTCYS